MQYYTKWNKFHSSKCYNNLVVVEEANKSFDMAATNALNEKETKYLLVPLFSLSQLPTTFPSKTCILWLIVIKNCIKTMMNELFPSYYNGARSHRWPHNENQPPHSKRPIMLPSPSTIASHFFSLILEIPILLWPWWWWLLYIYKVWTFTNNNVLSETERQKKQKLGLGDYESRYPKQRKQFFSQVYAF